MEVVSWIGLALAIVLSIERTFARIKKSKCNCCGGIIETEMTSTSPKAVSAAEIENQV